MKPQFVLALSCPDRPGIVHRTSGFLVEQGANILEAAQFDDVGTSRFFMRMQFEVNDVALAAAGLPDSFAGVKALKVAGSDLECTALARAVKWHAGHRVHLNGSKTLLFS